MSFYFGKAKNLTREVIARLFYQSAWNSLMNYTKTYEVKPPKHIQN